MALGDVVVGSGLCNGRMCSYAAAAMFVVAGEEESVVVVWRTRLHA